MNALKRALISAAILLILTCGARPAQAASVPLIGNLEALGIEICPQSVCPVAIFVGFLRGEVGDNPNAFGTFIVGIKHTDLPQEVGSGFAVVERGAFEFRFGFQRIPGIVTGGFIFKIEENTFIVLADLVTAAGQPLQATVVLDHSVFPPTVRALVEPQ